MKLKNTIPVLILVSTVALMSFTYKDTIKGWILAGSAPSKYNISVEFDNDRKGKVAVLQSKTTKIKKEFGTIMQSFIPVEYLGKRIRLSASIKSENVTSWSGMWMRVDGENSKVLSFDNMKSRKITGTTNWKRYEVVLNVPKNSRNLAYGVLLSGNGIVKIDDFKFEIVDKKTPVTGKNLKTEKTAPANTNFDN